MENGHIDPKQSHLLVVPLQAWGHLRPTLHLSVQLAQLHKGLHVSLLLDPESAKRAAAEFRAPAFASIHQHEQTSDGTNVKESVMDRIQVIPVLSKAPEEADTLTRIAQAAQLFVETLPTYLTALIEGKGELPDHINRFRHLPPSCLLYDSFNSYVPNLVASIFGHANKPMIPLLMFMPCGPSAVIEQFAKEEHDGLFCRMQRKLEGLIAAGDESLAAAAKVGYADCGKIIHLPGLPAMTDYELHPGAAAAPLAPQLIPMLIAMLEPFYSPLTTAIIAPSVQEMEEEAKVWFEDHIKKPFLAVGPQFPAPIWEGQIDPPSGSDDKKVMAFLDKVLEDHGKESLVYISFGSAFFPSERPDIVHAILDTLIAAKFPFLFAYATELFQVPTDLLTKCENIPNAMTIKVAPQLNVLHHPATGFFLSHAGASSMNEAFLARVPIIGIPLIADQGMHIELLKKYGAGIDVKQAKCFLGDQGIPTKLHDGTEYIGTTEAIRAEMTDLWSRLRGPYGGELRRGMEALSDLVRQSHYEGKSKSTIESMGKYF